MGCCLPSFLCPEANQSWISLSRRISALNPKVTYPNSVEDEWKAFFGQAFPLAQRVNHSPGSSDAQLPPIEQLGGQHEQGLMGTVVVDQLSHLK